MAAWFCAVFHWCLYKKKTVLSLLWERHRMYFKKDENLTANDKTIPIFRLARLPEDLIPGSRTSFLGKLQCC